MSNASTNVADPKEEISSPSSTPLETAPTPESLEHLIERAGQRQDFELLNKLQSQPDTPPEVRTRVESLMVEVLAEQAKQQGPVEECLGGDFLRSARDETSTEPEATKDTTLQRVNKMTVSEKLKAALFGSKEERFILIKSVNRIIAGAVLKSPKTSDAEIELITNMRNVHLEVLSAIAATPAWTRKRTIAINLIRNPRTPVALALRLLRQVTPRDLQIIARDRGISEAVRRTAQRSLVQKKHE